MPIRNTIYRTLSNLAIFLQLSCSTSENSEPIDPIDPTGESNIFFKGTTMGFVSHQEIHGNVVFKENGIAKDPYKSIYDHGGNMARFRIDLPPYNNNYTVGFPDVDFRSSENVKLGMQRAKNAGLETLLTFSYASMALDPDKKLNNYVAPLAWQPIAENLQQLKATVYNHTYDILKEYVDANLIPKIVSVGNEISWRFLEANKSESDLPDYDASRVSTLLNSGTKAVRDINKEYNIDIKIALHVGGVNTLKWWMETHMPFKLDFDIMGLSHYHEWTSSFNDFSSWNHVNSWLKSNYNKKFMVLETAQLFTTGGNDRHVDILGTGNIPTGYPNPPTTETQRLYLKDF
ncbi:MAG: glycosyl hydrolase 53 family protein, partial [Oleispira sp.]|nr:glycosyl hydrolase 53 family protein [Oleispira sp.]